MWLRKIERACEAIDLLEPREPEATPLLAPILESGLDGTQCWLAEEPGGGPAGLLTVTRLCPGLHVCRRLLIDAGAAPHLAAAAAASGAIHLYGFAQHVQPLLAHVRTAAPPISLDGLRFARGAFDHQYAQDPRVRVAQLSDLEGLVDLYLRYELEVIPPVRLWSLLRHTLRRRMILVAEDSGRLIAAYRLVACTRRWAWWDELTVLPDMRRRGVGWGLVHRAAREAAPRRPSLVDSQKQPQSDEPPAALGVESTEWLSVPLASKGLNNPHNRLRRALDGLEGRVASAALMRRILLPPPRSRLAR